MIVRDWVSLRTAGAPPLLVSAMLDALGEESRLPDDRAGEACIGAAARALDRLVSAGRFGRDSALDLLAIDALATLAYEFAAERRDVIEAIADDATKGIRALSAPSLARV